MRLDPLYQTRFRQVIKHKGRVIGEVYTLPQKMSAKAKEEVTPRRLQRKKTLTRQVQAKRGYSHPR